MDDVDKVNERLGPGPLDVTLDLRDGRPVDGSSLRDRGIMAVMAGFTLPILTVVLTTDMLAADPVTQWILGTAAITTLGLLTWGLRTLSKTVRVSYRGDIRALKWNGQLMDLTNLGYRKIPVGRVLRALAEERDRVARRIEVPASDVAPRDQHSAELRRFLAMEDGEPDPAGGLSLDEGAAGGEVSVAEPDASGRLSASRRRDDAR